MRRVYIAGRIEYDRTRFGLLEIGSAMTDWRNIGELHTPFSIGGHRFIYTGPYAMACDHGCAHTTSHTHAAALDYCGVSAPVHEAREATMKRSQNAIRGSDVVFAWFQDREAFGTLVEVGYAAALGKRLVVSSNDKQLLDGDLWFAASFAGERVHAVSAYDAFVKAIELGYF